MPKLTTKEVEPSATDDDILADKVETSNSTTSSINVRDPGDDLDTLLSKINDIVDDCIDNENENAIITETEKETTANAESVEHKKGNLDESVIFVEDSTVEECKSKMNDTSNNIKEINDEECEISNEIENKLEVEEEKINEISDDVEMSELVTNNKEKDVETNNDNEKIDAVT